MSNTKPENFSWMSPNLTVTDADAAIDFYKKAFNFQTLDKVGGDDGSTIHAELKYKDQTLMLAKQGAFGDAIQELKSPKSSGVPSPIVMYLYHEDVNQIFKQAIEAGAVALQEPGDMYWGDRMCQVQDPEGHTWCFATRIV